MISYLFATLVIAGIYAILALGLNVIWGLGGMVNLGLAGFFAVGAYTSALSSIGGYPIWLSCLLAFVIAGAIGALLARLTLNLQGDYLAIVTLGFGELVRLIASNEIWLTNGTDGISGIPGPWRGELSPYHFNMLFAALMVAGFIAKIGVVRLGGEPIGVLRAIARQAMICLVLPTIVIGAERRALNDLALGTVVVNRR